MAVGGKEGGAKAVGSGGLAVWRQGGGKAVRSRGRGDCEE